MTTKETLIWIMDKIKEFFGFGPKEYYDDEQFPEDRSTRGYSDEEDAYAVSRSTPRSYSRDDRHDRHADVSRRESRRESSLASERVSPAARRQSPSDTKYLPMRLNAYQDATGVVDVAKDGDVVVFTLSGVERTQAKRALDYISGASRALDAQLKKLSGVRNFILIPQGVMLDDDQLETLAQQL